MFHVSGNDRVEHLLRPGTSFVLTIKMLDLIINPSIERERVSRIVGINFLFE